MTWKNTEIPTNLPGYSKPTVTYGENFHKSQILIKVGGKSTEANFLAGDVQDDLLTKMASDPSFRLGDKTKPQLTHDERAAAKEAKRNTYRPTVQPAWLAHDRQVLRAFCHWTEEVSESNFERVRAHHCVIHHFLSDGTTEITEPTVANSGIPQGLTMKRHTCNKMDGTPFSPADLKMGGEIEIYSRKYKITSMDPFTEDWMKSHSFEIGEPCEAPIDDHTARQIALKQHAEKGLPACVVQDKHHRACLMGAGNPNGTLDQFLKHDGKVLRFYCYWDDKSRYGSRSFYTLHFFLCDDSIEVLERYPRNCGKANQPNFSKRGRLYKTVMSSCTPGMFDEEAIPRITREDLICGQHIDVRGRKFFLYDCDSATRKFCKDTMGVDQPKFEIPEEKRVIPVLEAAPYMGVGDPTDTMGSVNSLCPKPPRVDMVKLMVHSDTILRFEAVMDNCAAEDKARRFIVLFYPSKDEIAVFELKTRNSGQWEGKFADRMKRKNPFTGETFKMSDLFVGALITVSAVPFHLVRADEYTLKFMESQPEVFPLSDVAKICDRYSCALEMFKECTKNQTHVSPDEVRDIAEQCGYSMIDQELIHLIRYMVQAEKSDGANLERDFLISLIENGL